MKTTNGFWVVVLLLAGSVATYAGLAPLSAPQCARNMCAQMRECSTYVPQPSPVLEKVDSPKKGAASRLNSKAKGENVQEEIADCRLQAFLNFQDCVGGQQGERVKPDDATNKGTVKTAKVVTPNK